MRTAPERTAPRRRFSLLQFIPVKGRNEKSGLPPGQELLAAQGHVLHPEHGQHATLGAEVTRVTERAERAQSGSRIFGTDARGHADTGPATDTREHGHILLAIGTVIGHGVTDDARRGLVLPQVLAGLLVKRLEPAFHGAVEDQPTCRGEGPAVRREVLLVLPHGLALHRIPGNEIATVSAGAGEHPHDRADVRLTGGVLHLDAFIVHADMVCRDVEVAGDRRVRRWLLILEADRRGADALGVLLRGGAVLRILFRHAGGQIDPLGPVDRTVGLRHQNLTVGAVEGVAEAVTVEVRQQLLATALEQHVLIDAIVVPLIVRRHLIGPLHLPVVRVAGENGHGPLVVARPLIGVPAARVTGAVVADVQLGVVGVPAPGGAAAPLPLVTLPGRDAEILALVGRIVGVGVARDQDFAVRTRAVPAPDLFAIVDVVRRHAAADAELTARDTGDDDVLDHDRGVGHRGALLVVGVLHLPQLFAGLGIEREELTLQQLDEDFAAGMIGGATIDQVAAGDWNRIR